MKATYRRDNSRSTFNRYALLVGAAILGFAILSFTPVRAFFSKTVYSVAPFVWGAGDSVLASWNGFWGELRSKRALVEENTTLHDDVARMQAQVLDRNLLEERIAELEGMLGRPGNDKRVAARVLAGPGRSPYDTLVIDVGTENGVAVGDRVVYVSAGVVGVVAEAYSSSSKVKLYSFPGEEVSVNIGKKGIPATAYGRGMGNFETKVPRGSEVSVGDEVVVPGEHLLLGVVGATEEKPSLPFIRVLFRTEWNIAEMRSVEVVKSN